MMRFQIAKFASYRNLCAQLSFDIPDEGSAEIILVSTCWRLFWADHITVFTSFDVNLSPWEQQQPGSLQATPLELAGDSESLVAGQSLLAADHSNPC
jgi:hypothetical protein